MSFSKVIPYILITLDLITYVVWASTYVWLLHNQDPSLTLYRGMHPKYVSHLFATFTLLYMIRRTKKTDRLIVSLVFALALLFDVFNVVFTLRYLSRTDNNLAWSFAAGISITFMVLSALMFLWFLGVGIARRIWGKGVGGRRMIVDTGAGGERGKFYIKVK